MEMQKVLVAKFVCLDCLHRESAKMCLPSTPGKRKELYEESILLHNQEQVEEREG